MKLLERTFIIALLAILALAAGFLFYPQIDLWFSKFFYDPQAKFYLKHHGLAVFLHQSIYYIVSSMVAFFVIALLYVLVTRKKLAGILGTREIAYLVVALLVGPALIVNVMFKDNVFGRARPSHIAEFGGTKLFTPAFVIAGQCQKNCSFTSGHAAAGFYLTAFAFIIKQRRKLLLPLLMLPGVVIGMGRVIEGGHFLSDVIFSGVIVLLVNYTLARLML